MIYRWGYHFFGLGIDYKIGLHEEIFVLCYRGQGVWTWSEDYELPIVVKDMVSAYELASYVENRLIGIYIQLYAIENKAIRRESLQYALDGAIRILEFKQTPIALPGSIT